MHFKKILTPIADTPGDEDALRLACRLAKRVNGKVIATYVIVVDRSLPLDAEVTSEIEKGEEILDQAERIAEEEDYAVETDLLQAREAGPAIVDEAIERGVDTIMIGIEHKKRFGEFSLGSTVSYILKNAPCFVMLCREPMSGEQ